MGRRLGLRVAFGTVVALSSLFLVASYASAGGGIADRYEAPDASVDPREGMTVITTSPRDSSDASLIAFAPNGSVHYYNETYDYYFDVDPLEGTSATVEYVAVELFNENCAVESKVERGGECSRSVVERLNLTTGDSERIHTYVSRPVGIGGWHDVDRIDDSRLLVAGAMNDRVFIVNTSTDIIEWQWEAQSDFSPESGGRFPSDWSHINDVTHLEDGRIIVSMRNQDRVVFLDRETGAITEDTLGDEDDHETLYEQHNPDYIPREMGGPALLVADSENNRIVEYQLTDSGEWSRSWVWQDSRLQWVRDADRLPNGHTLIADSNGNRVFEVDRDGTVVWEVAVDTPYEAERFETGDESTGGESARRLGLESRSVAGVGPSTAGSGSEISVLERAIVFARDLLPPIVANGILFVLPAWFDNVDLLVAVTLLGTLLVWGVIEFRWSPYTLRSPLGTKTDRDR